MNKLTEAELVAINAEINAATAKWKAAERHSKVAYETWTNTNTAEERARDDFFETMDRVTTWILTGKRPAMPPEGL